MSPTSKAKQTPTRRCLHGWCSKQMPAMRVVLRHNRKTLAFKNSNNIWLRRFIRNTSRRMTLISKCLKLSPDKVQVSGAKKIWQAFPCSNLLAQRPKLHLLSINNNSNQMWSRVESRGSDCRIGRTWPWTTSQLLAKNLRRRKTTRRSRVKFSLVLTSSQLKISRLNVDSLKRNASSEDAKSIVTLAAKQIERLWKTQFDWLISEM